MEERIRGIVPQITPTLSLPEAVKKFRQQEFGWSGDARGRSKFTAPKQALISPWPARDLYHGSRNGRPFVLIRVFATCRRRSAEVGEVLSGHASPAGFWRREFAPSPGNKRGLCLPPFNIFTPSPVKGEGRSNRGAETRPVTCRVSSSSASCSR
jgi:hypothetical protein